MSLECLKLLYTFIQVRQLAPLLGLFSKNNTFGPRSRYRKKLPAAACSQLYYVMSSLRTKEIIRKGKESVASLMNVGVRPGGLNPICSAEIWKSIGLAKVLHGAQI